MIFAQCRKHEIPKTTEKKIKITNNPYNQKYQFLTFWYLVFWNIFPSILLENVLKSVPDIMLNTGAAAITKTGLRNL